MHSTMQEFPLTTDRDPAPRRQLGRRPNGDNGWFRSLLGCPSQVDVVTADSSQQVFRRRRLVR
jgi:hypothetical protein